MSISGWANMDIASTGDLRRKAKLRLLQMHFESGVGHLGGNLSALDILLCLYHFTLHKDDPLYCRRAMVRCFICGSLVTGALTDDPQPFHQDGTRPSGHPPAVGIPEIIFATGSLGHGLGLAWPRAGQETERRSWQGLLPYFRWRVERGFVLGISDLSNSLTHWTI